MNWDDQGPLVAALAAAIVWLTLELRRAQTDLSARVDELIRACDKFADKMGELYESRVAELRGLLEEVGRTKRALES